MENQEKRTQSANAPLSRRVGTLGAFFFHFQRKCKATPCNFLKGLCAAAAVNLALWPEIMKMVALQPPFS